MTATDARNGRPVSAHDDERRLEAARYSALHPGMVSKELHPDICTVCAHIATHGWTGLHDATHCRGCCAIWGGNSTIHCVTCHRTFSAITALDRHQTHHRDVHGELHVRCHDPAGVTTHRGQRHYFGEPRPNAWGVPVWRKFNDRVLP